MFLLHSYDFSFTNFLLFFGFKATHLRSSSHPLITVPTDLCSASWDNTDKLFFSSAKYTLRCLPFAEVLLRCRRRGGAKKMKSPQKKKISLSQIFQLLQRKISCGRWLDRKATGCFWVLVFLLFKLFLQFNTFFFFLIHRHLPIWLHLPRVGLMCSHLKHLTLKLLSSNTVSG